MRLICCALLLSGSAWSQSLFVEGGDVFGHAGRFKVGDLVEVSIVESLSASRESQTAISKQGGVAGGASGSLLGSGVSLAADASLSGRGSGSTRRDDRLAGVITARVQAIREDGGLELKGERAVDIDGELQRLTLKGVLRPEDVALDGSALSSRLAEAELKLNNSGSIARAGRLGWLQWILSWLGL